MEREKNQPLHTSRSIFYKRGVKKVPVVNVTLRVCDPYLGGEKKRTAKNVDAKKEN